jgi:serine/threonine protein kinase
MKKMLCQTREQVTDAQHELDALVRFSGKSENIISLIAHASTPSQSGKKNILREVYMVFPLFPQGTAWDAVEAAVPTELDGRPWPFNERKALNILIGTCRGLLVMHDQGVSHRDVKPHNILLGDDGTPVIVSLIS